MRTASLWVPDFPLQALRRSTPELAEAPLAVAAGPLPRDLIVCVAAEAAELDVRTGMTAAQARQVAPAALVRVTPEAAAAAADEALADVAGGFSPRVRRHTPGEVLLDAGGLVPRFGSEQAIAHELLRACRRVGLEARVGIAAGVGVARTAARSGELVVVRAGEEQAFMAPLPLVLLEPPPDLAAMLARWGLATAGELARLPCREVALRLGPGGVALHRLACGEETVAFVPDPRREVLREGVELDFPLGALEPFLFLTSGILSRLEQRLELRGEGFSEVLLELHLEGGGHRECRLKLVAPTREVPAVLALARLQLEASPPGAPVEGVAALVTPGRVRLAQGSLFGPASARKAPHRARPPGGSGGAGPGGRAGRSRHPPPRCLGCAALRACSVAGGFSPSRKPRTSSLHLACPAGVPAAAPGAGGRSRRPARGGAGGWDGGDGGGVGRPVPVRRRLVGGRVVRAGGLRRRHRRRLAAAGLLRPPRAPVVR